MMVLLYTEMESFVDKPQFGVMKVTLGRIGVNTEEVIKKYHKIWQMHITCYGVYIVFNLLQKVFILEVILHSTVFLCTLCDYSDVCEPITMLLVG